MLGKVECFICHVLKPFVPQNTLNLFVKFWAVDGYKLRKVRILIKVELFCSLTCVETLYVSTKNSCSDRLKSYV